MKTALLDLRDVALRSLHRMYRAEDGVFAFRLRRVDGRDRLEGISLRYTAMALTGLCGEDSAISRDILRGESIDDACSRMIELSRSTDNFGDVAAVAWAAAKLKHGHLTTALRYLRQLEPISDRHPTVERAWALTALSIGPDGMSDPTLAQFLARGLLDCFNPRSGVFSHQSPKSGKSRLRSHVACFADLVYPTIALCEYGLRAGDMTSLAAARRCADQMCNTQGENGQWWWHFDARTGGVIEEYPVYAVHQDAMAPMALFAAEKAFGIGYQDAIRRGLEWLAHAPEIDGALIDRQSDVIWRKVARREPNKLSRGLNAAFSAVHCGWRAPGLDRFFRPVRIDHESRPYHMGWILHAWPTERVEEFSSRCLGEFHESHNDNLADASFV
ncbi:MAG: hypothetical protein KF841_05935 [Phycisphaerae bacterium]|nr:hypothetical protein [Phycisphaerae bacterium]